MPSSRVVFVVAFVLVSLFAVVPLRAQQATPDDPYQLRPSVELFAGGVDWLAKIDGAITADNSRPYTYWDHTEHEAVRTSLLTMPYHTQRTIGADAGASWFPIAHVGVQGSFTFYRGLLSGPDTEIRGSDHQGEVAIPWPGLHGSVQRYIVSLAPIVRGRIGRRLVWSASAGFSRLSMRAQFGEYGHWYREGGSSIPKTLSDGSWHDSASSWGTNAGGSLAYRVAPRLAFTIDVRRFSSDELSLPARKSETVPSRLSHTRLFIGVTATAWRKAPKDIVDGWRAR